MSAEEILSKIVSINSVFPNEARLAKYISEHLEGLGFKVHLEEIEGGRYNVLAERGTKGKPILFYGHLDTVPIYGSWETEPLKLTEREDRLYGVGSCDMKGGIAAILESIKDDNGRKIKLLFCSDEENISEGVWTAVKKNREWLNDVFFALSLEPGDSNRHTGGENVITVGRRGRTVIEIDVTGLSSHGAMPQRGISAIDEAAKIVTHLKRFQLRKHRGLGKESIFVRNISSAATSLSIPDKAHLELDIQLVPPSTVQDAKERVDSFLEALYKKSVLNPQTKVAVSIKKRKTPYIEPYVNNLRNGTVRKVFGIVNKNIGAPLVNYGSSVADDNVLFNSLNVPVLTIGPKGGNEHTANEWVSRSSLNQLTKLYKSLIEEL